MKWNKDWHSQGWVPYTIATCSAVALYFALANISFFLSVLKGIWTVASPVFLAVIFSYLMDPIARFFEQKVFKKMKKRGIARQLSVVITVLLVIALFTLMIVALIPPLISSMAGMVTTISASAGNLQNNVLAYVEKISGGKLDLSTLSSMGENLFTAMTDGVSSGLSNALAVSYDIGSSVVTVVLGFVLAIYCMMDKERLQRLSRGALQLMLSKDHYRSFMNFCKGCDVILLRYISCTFIEAIIIGVVNGIFMLACGMDYVALISVIVGVFNMAPTFGPICGAAVGALLLLLNSPWYAAVWFIIFTLILQTVDGYILKPKLFGDSLGVSALLILITIIVGGRLFGVLGILLAIPFAAIAQTFVKDVLLKKKDIDVMREEKKDEKPAEKSGAAAEKQ